MVSVKKRGLSDVVTSVLLILLVLAAVVILWGFLSGFLKGAGTSISTVCMQLQIQPLSCVKNGDTTANISYKWVSGDVNLTGVNLILQQTNGNSKRAAGELLNLLETKVMTNVNFTGTPGTFTVGGVAITESGGVTNCPEYKDSVACK